MIIHTAVPGVNLEEAHEETLPVDAMSEAEWQELEAMVRAGWQDCEEGRDSDASELIEELKASRSRR